jgi:integrase
MTRKTMPQRGTGVHLRDGSNVWQWHIRTPVELKHLYTSKTWAHRCSLGTTDLRKANAKAAVLRAEWLETFEKQRRAIQAQQADAIASITPEIAADIAALIVHDSLSDDERLRTDPTARAGLLRWMEQAGHATPNADADPLAGMPDAMADKLGELHTGHDNELKLALARGKLIKAIPAVQRAALKLGLQVNEQTPGFDLALQAGLKAMREASAAKVRRDAGDIVETPPKAPLTLPKKAYTLRDVFAEWKAAVGPTLKPDSVRAKEIALEDYERFPGATPLSEITRAQGQKFKAWLLTRTELASKTMHQRMTDVKTLLKYASRELQWTPGHPWEGIDIPYKTESPRRPWTPEQLSALVNQPLFQTYELPKNAKAGADAAYWIPLLGIFLGARMGELCQLRTVDVRKEDDVWGIDINEEGDKAVKTDAGVRWVPIHPELVRLGFIDYADATRDAGNVSLWPKLHLMEGKASHGFSAWFNTYPRKAADGEKLPDFHSFRHTVRTKLMKAGVSDRIRDEITGHETKGSVGTLTYEHPDTDDLVAAIKTIKYPTLTLPRVYKTPAKRRAGRGSTVAVL